MPEKWILHPIQPLALSQAIEGLCSPLLFLLHSTIGSLQGSEMHATIHTTGDHCLGPTPASGWCLGASSAKPHVQNRDEFAKDETCNIISGLQEQVSWYTDLSGLSEWQQRRTKALCTLRGLFPLALHCAALTSLGLRWRTSECGGARWPSSSSPAWCSPKCGSGIALCRTASYNHLLSLLQT